MLNRYELFIICRLGPLPWEHDTTIRVTRLPSCKLSGGKILRPKMPKVDAKSEAQTCLKLTTQADIKAQTMALLVGDKGKALRELVKKSRILELAIDAKPPSRKYHSLQRITAVKVEEAR